jgi:Uri superfamily endonuclease
LEKLLKGIYILIIQISKTIRPKIGALGELTFPAGLYAYVGSAQNNLELRVKRHLGKEKRLFWHIDYLLNNEAAKIIDIYCRQGGKTEECHIASLLEKNGEPITCFGCSDCRCNSHLFRAESFEFLRKHMHPLKVNN